MRVLMKIVLIIGLFMILGFFQLLLKGGNGSGSGGPIGIILIVGGRAAGSAIWEYDPDKNNQKLDTTDLDKS